MTKSRRDLLRMLGAVMGNVAITGGSAGRILAQGALPNAYKFYRVFTLDPLIIFQSPIKRIVPGVMMGNYTSIGDSQQSDIIYFHGLSYTSQVPAIYRARLNAATSPPALSTPTLVLAAGMSLSNVDGLPDDQLPLVVGGIGTGSANALGHYATTIAVGDTSDSIPLKSTPGVYIYYPETNRFKKVTRFGDVAPGDSFYGILGDPVLGDDDTVTFSAVTTEPQGLITAQEEVAFSGNAALARYFTGTHILNCVSSSGSTSVLLRSGQLLPGTTAVIQNFGLVDVCRNHFVAQVGCRRLDKVTSPNGSAVIYGRTDSSERRLIGAEETLLGDRLRNSGDVVLGASIISPRVGGDGYAALVSHNRRFIDDKGAFDNHRLTAFGPDGKQRLLARAGIQTGANLTSEEPYIAAVGAAVVSSETRAVYFVEVLSDGTTRLKISDGSSENVLLQSGEQVDGLKITEIHHGYHPAQVGVSGRIAFAAEFLRSGTNVDPFDPNNILTAIVVGIPN